MELPKKKLEDLISAADKIIEANNQTQEDLFGQVKNPNAISEILGLSCNSWGIKFSQFPSCIYLC